MESTLPARVDRADPRTLLGPKLWRGHEQAAIRAAPTGFDALDRVLPGGGWPMGAVSEVLHARTGVGELSLALPLLARLTQAGRRVALVEAPGLVYAPRLAAAGVQLEHLAVIAAAHPVDALWSAELLLRAGAGAVLLWAARCETQWLRRLQLAAENGDGCLLLYRADTHATAATPSALRLRVWRERGSPCVEVLKCRGLRPAPVSLAKVAA